MAAVNSDIPKTSGPTGRANGPVGIDRKVNAPGAERLSDPLEH